jgi:hypothetical protein
MRQPTVCSGTREDNRFVQRLSSMLSTSTASTNKGRGFGQSRLRSDPHRLTLRVNFLWMLNGNVVYAASQWGMLVVLAKLGTPQLVGEFALAPAITAPIVIGVALSLRSAKKRTRPPDTRSEIIY